MAKKDALAGLSRREREIMDILFGRGRATAAEVRDAMDDAPSNSAVRTLLRILEDKGHIKHAADGPRYVYSPAQPLARAQRSAARHLVDTLFRGSTEQAVATLLDVRGSDVSDEEYDRLAALIAKARKDGR